MISGEMDKGSLRDVFRTLSLKKRNGILDVVGDLTALRVAFQEGVIVGVEDKENPTVLTVCRRLVSGGLLGQKVVDLVAGTEVTVEQLQELLVEKEYVTDEVFVRAKQGYETDLLHSLIEFGKGEVNFTPKIFRVDEASCVQISPGQFLLDLIELEEDEERFTTAFGTLNSSVCLVSLSGDGIPRNAAEVLICEYLQQSARRLVELRNELFLSRYDLIQGLLSLKDRGIISIERVAEVLPDLEIQAPTVVAPDVAIQTPTVADVPLEFEEATESDIVVSDTKEEPSENLEIQYSCADVSVVSGKMPAATVLDLSAAEKLPDVSLLDNVPVLLSSEGKPTMKREASVVWSQPDSESASDVDTTALAGETSTNQQSKVGFFKSLNYYVNAPEFYDKAVAVIALSFLLYLGFIESEHLSSWFNALAEFTSNDYGSVVK